MSATAPLLPRPKHRKRRKINLTIKLLSLSLSLSPPLLSSLLIGCFRGEGEKTQVTIRGGGPIGTVQCIAEATGRVKGLVGDASVDPPLRADGKLDVGAAVGRAGVCAVVRSPPFTDKGWEQPYTGMVALESGEIAEDLAAYLAESEQVQVRAPPAPRLIG